MHFSMLCKRKIYLQRRVWIEVVWEDIFCTIHEVYFFITGRFGCCEILAPSVLKSCTDNQTLIRLDAFQKSLF